MRHLARQALAGGGYPLGEVEEGGRVRNRLADLGQPPARFLVGELAHLRTREPLELVEYVADGFQLVVGKHARIDGPEWHEPVLGTAEEVLLDQLGLVVLHEAAADGEQLAWCRTVVELLELAARDHRVMAAEVGELGEEEDLVELRGPPGTVTSEPLGHEHHQLGELLFLVAHVHGADAT